MNYDLVWKYSYENSKLYVLENRNKDDSYFELYSPNDNREIDNLSYLKFINIPSILNVLELRYNINKIYTYNGNVLISINPFKKIDHLYRNIRNIKIEEPHIYSIAESAYRGYSKQNQSILVSGESGSGKTENTKYILKYLSYNYAENDKTAQNIINSNHIIEMLGNSKTMRNDNSSRFGKFIKLYIRDKQIIGANIENYLLEKSRITVFNKNERSYHIFYALNSVQLEKYLFRNDYRLLEKTDSTIIDEFKDIGLFLDSLKLFSFSEDHIDRIFYTIKTVLELLDIEDTGNILETLNSSLQKELDYLNIDINTLVFNFKHKTIKVGGEIIHKPLDSENIQVQIKSYCEDLYSDLFDWIISKINIQLGNTSDKYISILDIFGFEILEKNGYEQLCINYTNEILQQIYNRNVLENEQTEYVKEGINWNMIDYNSNNHIVKLFNSKLSIFGIINEQSILGSGSNKNIYNNFKSKLCSSNDIITISNKDYCKQRFNIKHYAGEVQYTVDNYILKNRIKSKNRKIKTNLHLFNNQLDLLSKELNKNRCLFVRCIKPNDTNNSDNYDQQKINDQLLYSGIIEGIKLILQGFPVKVKLDKIQDEFRFLKFNNKDIINILTENKEYGKQFAIGKSKLFLKKDLYNSLLAKNDKLRDKLTIFIQKNIRKWIYRKRFNRMKQKILTIQGFGRIIIAKKKTNILRVKKATKIICNKVYQYFVRCKFLIKKQKSIYLQSIFRKYIQIKKYKKLLITKITKEYLEGLIDLVISNYNEKLLKSAMKILMTYRRFKLNKRLKNRKDVEFLKKKLALKEKEANRKLQIQNENILMEKEELLVIRHRQFLENRDLKKLEREKLDKLKRELKLEEQKRLAELKDEQENHLREQAEKMRVAEELKKRELAKKDLELQNSLLEIEKLKKLLAEKPREDVKINNVNNDYIANKEPSDNFYDISIEEEQSAVKQVSQKLERMYLDLNEKNSRIDFLIKKYRALEQQKKEKNCIVM